MTWTALHLWMFGHPVTQDVQDSVGGGSSDDKLFVSVPLVSGETCGQVERERWPSVSGSWWVFSTWRRNWWWTRRYRETLHPLHWSTSVLKVWITDHWGLLQVVCDKLHFLPGLNDNSFSFHSVLLVLQLQCTVWIWCIFIIVYMFLEGLILMKKVY